MSILKAQVTLLKHGFREISPRVYELRGVKISIVEIAPYLFDIQRSA